MLPIKQSARSEYQLKRKLNVCQWSFFLILNSQDSSMASQENKPDCQKIEVISTNKISSSVSSDFLKFELNSRIVNGNANSGQESSGQHSPPLSPPPPRPQMTFLDLTQPKTLPNGVVLPPGTKQIIVHPYSRPIYWNMCLLLFFKYGTHSYKFSKKLECFFLHIKLCLRL